MPLATVTFDRVFDVVSGMKDRKEVTFFGFESNEGRQFSVPAPGKPNIRQGMKVTAFLREEGNWQTLVGWVEHSSGNIVIESMSYEAFSLLWLSLVSLIVWFGSLPFSYRLGGLTLVTISSIWVIRSIRSKSLARKALAQYYISHVLPSTSTSLTASSHANS